MNGPSRYRKFKVLPMPAYLPKLFANASTLIFTKLCSYILNISSLYEYNIVLFTWNLLCEKGV